MNQRLDQSSICPACGRGCAKQFCDDKCKNDYVRRGPYLENPLQRGATAAQVHAAMAMVNDGTATFEQVHRMLYPEEAAQIYRLDRNW